ncbi:hypothetical protein BGZ67_004200 [Mortierella alpina]|nr:hypothetical protein BGZ67_004200 [Mortierella alpina]
MAKHEVKDLDRVEQHEPLGGVLSSLRSSSDPFLMYQAPYAFQALQCVPDDETVLQEVMRHSKVVAESLFSIADQLQKAIIDTVGIAKTAIEGTRSLIESGQGVFGAIKGGVSSGYKRAWYTAIIGADALVREGRLADFKEVVLKAAFSQSHEFQWGICQLLGEIAIDPVWESATHQEAVDFLVELYASDPDWGQDASVTAWMLTILRWDSDSTDRSIKIPVSLQQAMDEPQVTAFAKSYPLITRLVQPEVSPLLARVQEIPYVERDLDQLRTKQLEEHSQHVYIPPQAKVNFHASDDDTLPLMDLVKDFLNSDRHVFLVLGNSGAGKSTFNRHLKHELWREYKQGDPVPLFINLPAVTGCYRDIIGEQLRIHSFSESKIKALKENRKMILICDGYDETQLKINLHTGNMLHQKGQADTKMVISCRSTYLGQDYRDQFRPQYNDRYIGTAVNLFTEAVIVPFLSAQIEDYVNQFVRDPEVHKLIGHRPTWSTENYMITLRSIPNMMELVKNPFLLSLSLRALPSVVKDMADLA